MAIDTSALRHYEGFVMTELERLKQRLGGVKNFHVDWAPGAALLTTEQRAAELNRVFDAIERGEFEEIESEDD